MRFIPRSKSPRSRAVAASRHLRGCLAAALVLLAACGGGTSQYEPFVAERVLVVGDDLSALRGDGKKYAVNGINTDGSLNCAAEPLWVQSVAALYGHVFKECNPGGATAFNGIMLAAAEAKVADIAAQVLVQESRGGFRDKDLVLALGGMHDVLELYKRYPAESSASLLAEARVRGESMAAVVNKLVALRAKVIVSTVPDLGLSPFARAEEATKPGSAAFLSDLTRVFNERLGVKVLLDGRFVGLMQTDLRTQLAVRFPTGYGLADATTGVCKKPLPDCTTAAADLLDGASAGTYLWADGTRLSSGGQAQLASLAIERATRNPF